MPFMQRRRGLLEERDGERENVSCLRYFLSSPRGPHPRSRQKEVRRLKQPLAGPTGSQGWPLQWAALPISQHHLRPLRLSPPSPPLQANNFLF
ncbi:hypothetical protein GN956_G25492 [Arapaima gigas]